MSASSFKKCRTWVDSSTKARSSSVTRGSCVGPGEPGEHKSRTRGSLAISSEGNGEISALHTSKNDFERKHRGSSPSSFHNQPQDPAVRVGLARL